MLKKIGLIILLLLFLLIVAGILGVRHFNNLWFAERPNYLTLTYESQPIAFEWAAITTGNHYEPHNALLIPIKIGDLPHKFYWQFDTGAPTTLVYGNSLNSLKELGLDFQKIQMEENTYVQKLEFVADGSTIKIEMPQVLENYGSAFSQHDTAAPIKIGTLGADYLDQRITLIDFKHQYIQLYEEKPAWMASLNFQSFDFTGRRFMLPASIDGKDLSLFYDSGSSAFGLITSKNRYDDYTNPDEEEIQYAANRFGESLTIHHKASDTQIKIGTADLPLRRISYVDMYAPFQRLMTPFTRIGGWLGNKPFIENTLILDTKSEEFIVIDRPSQ